MRDSIKNREVPHNFVGKINVFINEIKSIGDNEVEANDDEALDENDQHKRESGCDECDVDID